MIETNDIDTSWMTKAQRNFFNILSIEENRNKSRIEISKLAGYDDKKTNEWYRVIKDSKFRDLLQNMNVKALRKKEEQLEDIIDGIDVSWMTIPQRKFFKVLSKEENKNKSRGEICELAGYHKNATQWYTAINDIKFFKLLKSINVHIVSEKKSINGIDISWMTVPQKRFIEVLSKEENRSKSVVEICKEAGYSQLSTNQWYKAISNKKFFELLKSMEVRVVCKSDSKEDSIDGIDVSWMSFSQKNFFRVLYSKENRNKSRTEICKLANHTESTWYTCIKDERFLQLLISMDINIICEGKYKNNIINGVDVSWMTISQRKIYQVLTNKENINKDKIEICELAGYSKKTARSGNPWYNAINDEKFLNLLKSMGVKSVYNIVSTPNIINGIDVSYMTIVQKKFLSVLSDDENKNKSLDEIYVLAGYKIESGRSLLGIAMKDEKFINLLKSMNISFTRKRSYLSHDKVKYIEDINCRKDYIQNNKEWDMRLLFKTYPRHMSPSHFIVDFTKIQNKFIREELRHYFIDRLNNWEPSTFTNVFNKLVEFFECIDVLFEDLESLYKLERVKHIEPILEELKIKYEDSNVHYNRILNAVQSMFYYMEVNNTENIKYTELINIYDKRIEDYSSNPKPIPLDIRNILDNYLNYKIIPLLEKGEQTPIVNPEIWDMIIIARYTGRRTEDICHLISDDTKNINYKIKTGRSKECLQYDLDGEPMLYLDHRIAKIKKDLMITIAHLKDSRGVNIVEQAVLRQMKRVENLPCAPDGYRYLFREIKKKTYSNKDNKPDIDLVIDLPLYPTIRSNLIKICNNIPLKNVDGSIYNISMHQFRHTVATEMIDAGIDIWAVKEFLGHDSVAMTEKYIKAYENVVRKEFKERLIKSDSTEIKKSLEKEEELFTSEWVKNKIIAVFEQGDGCCEHIYKIAACPHMECKICRKRKIYPRHITAVKDTISSYSMHRDNAQELGLTNKYKEFDMVVKFYTVALKIITSGKVFDAEIDFYKNN